MSKMAELDAVISELRTATAAIEEAVNTITEMFSGSRKPEPKSEPAPVITREAVRAILAEKSSRGFTAEVRTLLKAHGADKLSGIDPDESPALIKEAEAIGNE